MVLMLASSMVANAEQGMFLRGGYNEGDPNWNVNRVKFEQVGEDLLSAVYPTGPGFEFKLYYKASEDVEGVWIGSAAAGYDNVVQSVPFTFTGVKPGEGDNMIINLTGTYRFTYNTATFELEITAEPCPVEVATDLVGGTVTADKTEAAAGETVTITVTPDYGYATSSSNVDIELTANPGSAQAPHHAPQVGEIIHPEGDAQATHDAPATYTFTMPEYPFGVYISANFNELNRHKIVINNRPNCTVTTDQPDDNAVPVGTVVTLTSHVTSADDFFAPSIMVNSQVGVVPFFFEQLENDGADKFTFTMPDLDVEVSPGLQAYLHGVEFDDERHWATYYGAYNLMVPENVTAYAVTGVENDEVQVQQFFTDDDMLLIPKNMGVLLYSETPMRDIVAGVFDDEKTPNPSSSLLQGSVENMEVSSGYVLVNDTFYRSQVGTLPAHRCYLPMASVPAGAPRVLKIVRPGEGGIITSVNDLNTSDVVSVKYVNAVGMTSDKPFEGMNVKVVTRSDGTTETSKIIK